MVSLRSPDKPLFRLSSPYQDPLRRLLFAMMSWPLERILHFPELNRIYEDAAAGDTPSDFMARVLNTLGVRCDLPPGHLERIPKTGPLIVVANHPFGALDGVALVSLLRSVRPDAKVLANYLLRRVPQLHDCMIFVDPFGRERSRRANLAPLREAMAWVRNGGTLGMFPAGEVAHLNMRERRVCDPPWSETVARLVRRTRAPVLPVFFEGRNGSLFHMAGLVHPSLRTLMLPHTLVKRNRSSIRVRTGTLIPFEKLEAFTEDRDLVAYLRMRTCILDPQERRRRKADRVARRGGQRHQRPIIDPLESRALSRELATLPHDQLLVATGDFQTWVAEAGQIPQILREIGRLRELTFRQAGEGTGQPVDLDRYDQYYLHLFLWNRARDELVGAYRLGQTDRILPRYGERGLYTCSLFSLARRFLTHIHPALELGRSFLRPEYQRQHSPLNLLWKGIGRFVARNPRYKNLLGPVSISNEYRFISQQLMISFLQAHSHLPELARFTKPRNPPRWRRQDEVRVGSRLVSNVDEVSALISDIELDRKGVPVLLRQYLRLNAKFLTCSVDPDFADVVDGLMMADLTEANPRILERYLGKDESARYLDYHGARSSDPEGTPRRRKAI